MPSWRCLRTTSATALASTRAKATVSVLSPATHARPMAMRFAGRDRLPACGVRMRSVLRFMLPGTYASAYLGSTNW